jgi:hypothetical protein
VHCFLLFLAFSPLLLTTPLVLETDHCADEPTVPYDSMDPEAKELLDSLLERQAYVNAGLIDLENGFDDFRVVIGESSLGGPTS